MFVLPLEVWRYQQDIFKIELVAVLPVKELSGPPRYVLMVLMMSPAEDFVQLYASPG